MASRELINIIIKATDEASATAKKVDNNIKNMGNSVSRLSKIPGFDAMKTKLSSVAQTIDGKFGGALTKARNRFNNLRTSVGNVTSTIKGRFGSAIDGIRNKLTGLGGGAKNVGSSFGFLRGAASMAAGMIGYDLLNSLMETTRASLNARSSMQAFAQRLNMSATEVTAYQKSLDELQQSFKKIDMDVVGQQATDMAYRLGLPKTSLTELTETTAIFTDAMQRNGRSAEDSMLAMSDAMDGQFVRLKEIGIGQDDLMKNGWDGDINNKTALLDAMNKSLKEQHYDDLAKSVDTLDDAWQVLTITMGNLLESVLVPLTPVIVGIVSGITNAINGIKSAWDSLPDWGKMAIGIGAIAVAVGILVPALMAAEVASLPLVGTLMAVAGAVTAISLPVVAAVAAIALLVVAIYEVGKAFGWWTDASSMIDAIGAGLQRLWDAFVNHPDVQALIQAISSGWEWLSGAIGRAWQAVLNFFGISSSSNFDIVATLIQGIGAAWDMIREPVMAYCDQVMLVLSVIASVIDGNMSMSDAVIAIWNGLVQNIPIILSGLGQLLGTIWAGIGSLMLSVVRGAISGIVGWFASLPGRILAYLTATRNYIFTQMLNWVQVTRQRAMEIITGILTFFRTLPGKVLAILAAVGRHILSQGMQWIVNAKTRATGVVNGVINLLLNLPGKVYSALHAAAKSILDAGKEWVDAAKEKAQAVVDGAYNTLSGLPGKISSALGGVASAITKPFQDAYDTAKGIWDKIVGMASNTPNVSNYGGFDLDANGNPIIETGAGRHDVLDVNISLKDVPDGVDETFLVEVITSRSVIDALVNNQYYQSANSTANLRYQGKVLRSG